MQVDIFLAGLQRVAAGMPHGYSAPSPEPQARKCQSLITPKPKILSS